MTDKEFKKSTKGKTLTEFTRSELMKACEFERYATHQIISLATQYGWQDVADHAGSFEDERPRQGWYKPAPTIR